MHELLQQLEADNIPAPSPIEQRWSAPSSSPMSPVASTGDPDALHSWVGIIMYLPTEEKRARQAITDRYESCLPCVPFCFLSDLIPQGLGQVVQLSLL